MQIFCKKNDADMFYNTKRDQFWPPFVPFIRVELSFARCVGSIGRAEMWESTYFISIIL